MAKTRALGMKRSTTELTGRITPDSPDDRSFELAGGAGHGLSSSRASRLGAAHLATIRFLSAAVKAGRTVLVMLRRPSAETLLSGAGLRSRAREAVRRAIPRPPHRPTRDAHGPGRAQHPPRCRPADRRGPPAGVSPARRRPPRRRHPRLACARALRAPLRAYLRRLGYDAHGWGFGTNLGDTSRDIDRLAERLLELVEETGSPASLVGWSLGGVIAREVARRHPAAVRRVITYGTPVGGPTYTTVARAYSRGPDPDGHREARRLDETNPDPGAADRPVLAARRHRGVAGLHRPHLAPGRARRDLPRPISAWGSTPTCGRSSRTGSRVATPPTSDPAVARNDAAALLVASNSRPPAHVDSSCRAPTSATTDYEALLVRLRRG